VKLSGSLAGQPYQTQGGRVEFRRAASVDQALAWLSEHGESARVIAGGTDAMMQVARGEIAPATFVHIEGVRSLAAVDGQSADGQSAPQETRMSRLGALVPHRTLASDPAIRRRHPALSEAAATVGGWQTQAVGTLGGNICNASPAADTAAPLLVADAVVELRSSTGSRRVPLADFFLGRRAIDRRPDELVTAIEAEPLGLNAAEVYLKVGRRGAMVVAVVGLAVRLQFDPRGERVTQARVALCSVAPTPVRARAAERILAGGGALPDAVSEAGQALLAEVAPIDDARGTAAYRRMVLPGLLARAVAYCRTAASVKETSST
jgi:aerobic carbon-monoxide dehydrogenase medium subunit